MASGACLLIFVALIVLSSQQQFDFATPKPRPHRQTLIAPNYMGFSIEWNDMASIFTPGAQKPVTQLFANLQTLSKQPVLIRIGGISEDNVWLDGVPGRNATVFPFSINMTVMNNIAQLATQVPIQYLAGLPTVHSMNNVNATVAFMQAMVDSKMIAHMTGVELGNEPHNFGIPVGTYVSNYWMPMLQAIYNNIPASKPLQFAGLSSYNPQDEMATWTQTVSTAPFVTTNHIKTLATVHTYGTYGNVSLQTLLGLPSPTEFDYIASASATYTDDIILGETNSIIGVGGGIQGVSNVFGSALWSLDFYAYAAWNGLGSARLHGVMGAADFTNIETAFKYSPFLINQASNVADKPVNVRPIYYSMIAFTNALSWVSSNQDIVPIIPSAKTNTSLIKIYGFQSQNNTTMSVIIINKTNQTIPVSFMLPAADQNQTSAVVEWLRAPNVTSTLGITYAAQTFDGTKDGLPIGARKIETIQSVGGVYNISMPQYSASVILVGGTQVKATNASKVVCKPRVRR
ncbi:hypothetical protein SmJEL517_g01293 [Synchytrium microbalum]|uniref:Beta-glucuronidase C-terminal domain-containing protein n=1 Tax=Synchytrium microbalum TaxID=1806994 RepID=A0A507CF25_9FUNG|nr:uncharacterized protein SmJEL517_g01293 [Synchytrium microbalum]TPX36596.1 hypothetical protein SmJEL517_g01293 [Synchytrium microbalum]